MCESQKYYYKLRVLSSQMNTRIMDLISMLKPISVKSHDILVFFLRFCRLSLLDVVGDDEVE